LILSIKNPNPYKKTMTAQNQLAVKCLIAHLVGLLSSIAKNQIKKRFLQKNNYLTLNLKINKIPNIKTKSKIFAYWQLLA